MLRIVLRLPVVSRKTPVQLSLYLSLSLSVSDSYQSNVYICKRTLSPAPPISCGRATLGAYVCLCNCLYERIHACMYVCPFVWLHVSSYACMCVCLFVYMYVCMCAYLFVCMHAYIHTYTHTHFDMRTYTRTLKPRPACSTHTHTQTPLYPPIYKHKHWNIHTQKLLYTHLHTHILIYTRTHIPTHTHAAAAALQHSDDAARRATVCCSSMSYMDTWYKWCGSTLSSTDSRCKLRFDHVKTVAPKISGTSTSAPPSISIRATCEPSVCGEGGGWRGEGAFECVRVFKERRRVKRTHGV